MSWVSVLGALVIATAPVSEHRRVAFDGGGWFTGLFAHPSGRVFGYGDVYGLYRTDDWGQKWDYLQGDFKTQQNFVSGLGVSIQNRDLIFIRTWGFLFRSRDGGKTWTQLLDELQHNLVRGANPVVVNPWNDREIWLCTVRTGLPGSLWRSRDQGDTWEKVGGSTFDANEAVTVTLHPRFQNQVWVGAKGGFFASTDRGESWTKVWNDEGRENPFYRRSPWVYTLARRDDGVAAMAADGGGYRISAPDWNRPETYQVERTLGFWPGWGPSGAMALANGDFVMGGDGGGTDEEPRDAMRISRDGAKTWRVLPMKLVVPPLPTWHPPVQPGTLVDGGRNQMIQHPTQPNRWMMTGGMIAAMTQDAGATWKMPPNASGIAGVMTYKVVFPSRRPSMALVPSSDLGVFVITDHGKSGDVAAVSNRTIPGLFTTHEVMSDPTGRILLAAGVAQAANRIQIMRSDDSGANWREIDITKSGLPPNYEGVTRALMSPTSVDDYLVLLGQGGNPSNPGLWRTRDGGKTFTKAVGIPDGQNMGMRYHPENAHLVMDGRPPHRRYLSIRDVATYRSDDGGSNWTQIGGPPFGKGRIQSLAIDPTRRGFFWAALLDGGLARSRDGMQTWERIPGWQFGQRLDARGRQVAVFGRRDGDTWNKLYYSRDDGRTWTEKSEPGYRYAFLSDVAIDPAKPGVLWVSGISVNVVLPRNRTR